MFFEGDVTLSSAAEADALFAEYGGITGDLTLEGSEALNLTGLVEVGGTLRVIETDLPAFDAPNLRRVGWMALFRSNPSLLRLDAPDFEEIGAQLHIAGNGSIESVDLRSLRTVALLGIDGAERLEGIFMEGQPTLETVDFSALEEVPGLININQHVGLSELVFPSLETTAGLQVDANRRLTTADFPVLEEVTGDIRIDHIGYEHREDWGDPEHPLAVLLPALEHVGGSVFMDKSTSVTSLDLSALRIVDGDAEVLGQIVLESLDLGSLETVGGTLRLEEQWQSEFLDLGSLVDVGALRVHYQRELTELAAPDLQLIRGDLWLQQMDSLEVLDFDSLERIDGDLRFRFLESLPISEVDALIDYLGPAGLGGEGDVDGM